MEIMLSFFLDFVYIVMLSFLKQVGDRLELMGFVCPLVGQSILCFAFHSYVKFFVDSYVKFFGHQLFRW